MQRDTYLFMVWAHRSAGSIFGAASNPVMRNGRYLCFEDEEKARTESDRLNARSGGSNVHYSARPTRVQMALPAGRSNGANGEPQYTLAFSDAPCTVRPRSL